MAALTLDSAMNQTLELLADSGPAPTDRDALFGALQADDTNTLDAVLDRSDMPPQDEPASVQGDLEEVHGRFPQRNAP